MNKKTINLLTIAFATVSSAVFCFPLISNAAGSVTIQIDQKNEAKVLGNWTLIRPDNANKLQLNQRSTHEATGEFPGKYSLLIEPPQGASTSVKLFIDGELKEESERPQVTFDIQENQTALVEITYVFTRVGKVSVNSTPSGIRYTLVGPDGAKWRDSTPGEYLTMPEGLYSVTFEAVGDCPQAKPISDRLKKDGRIDLSIQFKCEGMEKLLDVDYEKKLTNVVMRANGNEVVLTDVQTSDWFATYVHEATRAGIMSGYQDSNGQPTGKYGPSDNVNMAQLVKIAHKIASIDVSKVRTRPKNLRAQDQWYEQFYASAEDKYWRAYMDIRHDPAKLATRGEVIATILQALDVKRYWATGKIFSDVKPDMKYAAAIETAAIDGLIDSSDSFRPTDNINRAEIAKIISKALKTYAENSAEIQPGALDGR